MAELKDLALGTRVRYSNALQRVVTSIEGAWDSDRKDWRPCPHPIDHPEIRGEGIVVGIRTLQNGTRHWNEDAMWFRTDERITAVMVAHRLRCKPVFVLLEHLEVVPTLDSEGNPIEHIAAAEERKAAASRIAGATVHRG